MQIDSCTFSNNFASEHGGALYLSRFDTLTFNGTDYTDFMGNLAKISGSDIYALQSDGNLTMVGTQFDVMQGGGPNSIHMEGVKYMGTAIKIKSKTRPF